MLSGFTSRWTISFRCRWMRPKQTCSATSNTRPRTSGPLRRAPAGAFSLECLEDRVESGPRPIGRACWTHDPRGVHLTREPRFTEEALPIYRVLIVQGIWKLDDYRLPGLNVPGRVDRPHSPFAIFRSSLYPSTTCPSRKREEKREARRLAGKRFLERGRDGGHDDLLNCRVVLSAPFADQAGHGPAELLRVGVGVVEEKKLRGVHRPRDAVRRKEKGVLSGEVPFLEIDSDVILETDCPGHDPLAASGLRPDVRLREPGDRAASDEKDRGVPRVGDRVLGASQTEDRDGCRHPAAAGVLLTLFVDPPAGGADHGGQRLLDRPGVGRAVVVLEDHPDGHLARNVATRVPAQAVGDDGEDPLSRGPRPIWEDHP